MPTKAELNKRLTAARFEIKRLQQCRDDLSRVQGELHEAMVEIVKVKNRPAIEAPDLASIRADSEKLSSAMRSISDSNKKLQSELDGLRSLPGKLTAAKRELTAAQREKDALSKSCARLSRDLEEAISHNKALRGQYKPTSEQVRLCLEEIDRLKSLFGAD